MKYKIIIFDIGGTLLDKRVLNEVSDDILCDIRALQKKNIKVGVCSMRTHSQCNELIPVALDFYICLNGSHIVCENNIIHDSKITEDISVSDMLTYSDKKAYYSSQQSYELAKENGFAVDEQGIATNIYNLVMFNVNVEEISKYNKYHFEYWPLTKSLMLQNRDSSKCSAIKQVLQYFCIDDKILYFGDGPNDLEIFKQYDDCVCMGNCYPGLDKYAIFKTGTVAQNGVSSALRKLKIL